MRDITRNVSALVRHFARQEVRTTYSQYKRALDTRKEMEKKSYLFPDLTDLSGEITVNVSLSWSNYISIEIPWNDEIFNEIIRRLWDLGWEYQREVDSIAQWREYAVYYNHPNFNNGATSIRVERSADRKGSECAIVIDHYEEVRRPVYRLNCEEDK